jgi:polyhydroxybutyrate depolymerase
MTRLRASFPSAALSAAIVLLGAGCVPLESGQAGSGGTSGGSGGAGTGGQAAPGTGGAVPPGSGGATATGGAASGGSMVVGSGGAGGAVGTGGRAQGSGGTTSGGSSGRGGTPGSGGVAASGGAGGAAAVVPSAGCGKSGRPANGVVTVANDHIYTFPTSYDGSTPFPLLIGLHAAGNPIEQIRNLTNGSAFETSYVRAFPKSAGNEWSYNTDISKVLRIYDELVANYCVDTGRVFGTGHSSGAQMIFQILTKSADAMRIKFKAVAPVAASNYGAIASPIAVMYIQGKMDTQRGNSNGADVVARFTTVNRCSTTTMPYPGVAMCMSGSTSVAPGCVRYDGCTQPTVWCSHNDPAYSNTNHGWPCFATKAMYDFFASLP